MDESLHHLHLLVQLQANSFQEILDRHVSNLSFSQLNAIFLTSEFF